MSSGWIKMGVHLRTHPKVVRLAAALKADRLRVIGGLWAVWCVFDAHSETGELPGYTLAAMDEQIGWRGFSQAMVDIGWLRVDGEDLVVPDYESHNGPTAKRRATDASRKGKARKRGQDPDESPPPKRTNVRDVSASDADKTRNREEKRRESANALSARGEIGQALKRGGMDLLRVNLQDPRLTALLEQGATADEFEGLAREAVAGGKGFAWVLAVLPQRRQQAAGIALAPRAQLVAVATNGVPSAEETRRHQEAEAAAPLPDPERRRALLEQAKQAVRRMHA